MEDRTQFFRLSACPITDELDDLLEQVSGIASGEMYTDFWEPGVYQCAQCETELFSSEDKWKGPCPWPSFRRGVKDENLYTRPITGYNGYEIPHAEVYCAQCKLFLG